MDRRLPIIGVLVPLLLAEIVSGWKLDHWLMWTSEPWLAACMTLAFLSFLIGSIVAMSLEIPAETRGHVQRGGLWLFALQALANTLIAFQSAVLWQPVEVMTRFFGTSPEVSLKVTAVLAGCSLSFVSITFWSVLAHLLKRYRQDREQLRDQLKAIDRLFQEAQSG